MKIWNNPFRKILLFSLLLLSFSSAQAEENQKETLLFLPLDNRPVCSSYVAKTMEQRATKYCFRLINIWLHIIETAVLMNYGNGSSAVRLMQTLPSFPQTV